MEMALLRIPQFPSGFLLHLTLCIFLWSNIDCEENNNEVSSASQSERMVGSPGKVSKVFPIKKSSVGRVWKVNPTEETNYPSPVEQSSGEIAFVNNLGKNISDDGDGQNSTSKHPTWSDLSVMFGEAKIKRFLHEIPLELLRNITRITKTNPKLGERKLIELIMQRNSAELPDFHKNLSIEQRSGEGSNVQLHIYLPNAQPPQGSSSSGMAISSTFPTKNLGLESPKNAWDDKPSNPITSNYENMPTLTNSPPPRTRYPVPTFTHPGYFVPTYIFPKLQGNNDQEPTETLVNTHDPDPSTSSVWVAPSQNSNDKFVSNIRLLPASSNGEHHHHLNSFQLAEEEVPASYYNEYEAEKEYNSYPNPNKYHYSHSVVVTRPPPTNNHAVVIDSSGLHENPHYQNIGHNHGHEIHDISSNSSTKPSLPPESSQVKEEQPVSNSPSHSHGLKGDLKGGILETIDWGLVDIWNKIKTYLSKHDKSTSEKVFEVSISILSFLAFGFYMFLLVYQVLAGNNKVPRFPLRTTSRPTNAGRSLDQDGDEGSFGLKQSEEEEYEIDSALNSQYIEELENVVKNAMKSVKEKWSKLA